MNATTRKKCISLIMTALQLMYNAGLKREERQLTPAMVKELREFWKGKADELLDALLKIGA